MFSPQQHLDDLLAFATMRVQDENGDLVTEEKLADVFHQPFAELRDPQNRVVAELPVPQVRLAVEVLRRYLGDAQGSAEAEYREAAFDSLLAQWDLSLGELRRTRTALQSEEAQDAQEMVNSLAERLGVAPQRVHELLAATEELDEETLEVLFGLPSTRHDPFAPRQEPPRLLQWQREQLPAFDEEPEGNGEGREERSVREQAEQTLEQTLRAAVAAAEAEALPRLRDSLVAAAGAQDDIGDSREPDRADVIDSLTRRLALDFGNSGQVKTTRVQQATETLQTVLFGLRTGLFGQRQHVSVLEEPPTAADWEIAYDDKFGRAEFDEDWHWLGRYETWRGAFETLVYPDAALHPGLLAQSPPHIRPSKAFRTLVEQLRATPQLSPRRTRQLANESYESYLAMLREDSGGDLPSDLRDDDFAITERLQSKELETRQTTLESEFDDLEQKKGKEDWTGRWPREAPNWLKEIYYFVPILLALHLQRNGHFQAALAWYRTIYAYDWEAERRKIFYGLVLEEDLPLTVERTRKTWLRTGLDPHDIAAGRGHAYTRFTLQSIIGCLLDFADAEFTAANAASRARARSLYLAALDLLELPEMLPPQDERAIANPVLGGKPVPESVAVKALRQRAELSLEKLRSGRNIAGMAPPQHLAHEEGPTAAPFHRTVVARPTIYRYRVLVERAQRLAGIAQQMEASFLASAEKADAEAYNLLRARQDLALSREQASLQDLRVDEAGMGIELAQLQRERAQAQRDSYQEMIEAGPTAYEREMIHAYRRAGSARLQAAELSRLGNAISSVVASAGRFTAGAINKKDGVGQMIGAFAPLVSANFDWRATTHEMRAMETTVSAQVAQVRTGFEQRKQERRRQYGLAQHDVSVGLKQVEQAQLQQRLALQERGIAELQTEQAAVTLEFLANKFTNAELYEWMSGVLNRVYRYFLQQATATALLAQNQLAFERQEKLPGFIQQDYWRPPSEGETATDREEGQPDRRGLTGSARLLQDIYRLDQFAFKTRERKLELSQTFSLAQLFPFEFERFRQTGRLPFATPTALFDRGFPGHYLRLIKRVSVSVLALVPPSGGIRATLMNSGVSRVVVGPDVFRTVEVQRSPELIAFTSPLDATGLFTLEPEGELLYPFEGQGVDTTWQLEMPQAANAIDYRTIADVLLTIDYTAQYSESYRRQVVAQLDRILEAERPFHFRQEFADQWYDLHNADDSDPAITVRFETRREDFPPHVDDLRIEHLLLFLARADGSEFELPVDSLRFSPDDGEPVDAGGAESEDGIISTRRANDGNWTALQGRPPLGEWELTLPNTEEVQEQFADEQIEDILFIITYKGKTPEWPV